MVKRIFLVGLFLLLAVSLLSAMEPKANMTDKEAKDFSLKDLGNNQVSLSDFKDRPVVLFFWTTWCPHCRGELDLLNNGEYEKIKKDGIELLTINAGEKHSKVDNFAKSLGLAFRILLDEDTQVVSLYGVVGVPTYIFINKQGSIVSTEHHFNRETYKKLISQ